MKLLPLTFTVLIAGSLALSAQAGKPEWAGKKSAKAERSEQRETKQQDERGEADEISVSDARLFSRSERELIRDYYGDQTEAGERDKSKGKNKQKHKALPKGLQKKLARGGELPPGWQKKLARGEVLEPELRVQGRPLPEVLEERLPGEEQITEIIRIQDKVVRVLKGEGTVVDIIDLADVFSGRGMRSE